MDKLLQKIRARLHVAISVPAIMCFVTFLTNLMVALKDNHIDNAELHQLLSSADGFEAIVLVIVMLILKDNKN